MKIFSRIFYWLCYSVPGILGIRSVDTSLTEAETRTLRKYAAGRKCLLEIGVFEGYSALEARKVMSPDGELYLVDPYPQGVIKGFNVHKLVARRYLNKSSNGRVVWVPDYSFNAVKTWNKTLDYFFHDADHSEESFEKDLLDWEKFVRPGGVALFHDARRGSGTGVEKVIERLIRANPRSPWKIIEECERMVVAEKTGDTKL